jgi:hypothetical protein
MGIQAGAAADVASPAPGTRLSGTARRSLFRAPSIGIEVMNAKKVLPDTLLNEARRI